MTKNDKDEAGTGSLKPPPESLNGEAKVAYKHFCTPSKPKVSETTSTIETRKIAASLMRQQQAKKKETGVLGTTANAASSLFKKLTGKYVNKRTILKDAKNRANDENHEPGRVGRAKQKTAPSQIKSLLNSFRSSPFQTPPRPPIPPRSPPPLLRKPTSGGNVKSYFIYSGGNVESPEMKRAPCTKTPESFASQATAPFPSEDIYWAEDDMSIEYISLAEAEDFEDSSLGFCEGVTAGGNKYISHYLMNVFRMTEDFLLEQELEGGEPLSSVYNHIKIKTRLQENSETSSSLLCPLFPEYLGCTARIENDAVVLRSLNCKELARSRSAIRCDACARQRETTLSGIRQQTQLKTQPDGSFHPNTNVRYMA
jgi:hypothetical protein